MICRNNLTEFKRNVSKMARKSQQAQLDALKMKQQQSCLISNLHEQVLSQTQIIIRLEEENKDYHNKNTASKKQIKQLAHKVCKLERNKQELEFKLQRQIQTNKIKQKQIQEINQQFIESERKHKEYIAELERELMRARFPFTHKKFADDDEYASNGMRKKRILRTYTTENKQNIKEEKSYFDEETKLTCMDSIIVERN